MFLSDLRFLYSIILSSTRVNFNLLKPKTYIMYQQLQPFGDGLFVSNFSTPYI